MHSRSIMSQDVEGNMRLSSPDSTARQQLCGQLFCFFKDKEGMIPGTQHFAFQTLIVFYITWTYLVKDDKFTLLGWSKNVHEGLGWHVDVHCIRIFTGCTIVLRKWV